METNLLQKLWVVSDSLDDQIGSDGNKFCKGPFWNSTLTWHTNDPDITECFRDSILVGVPCAFLWIIGLPLWIRNTLCSNTSENHSDKILL